MKSSSANTRSESGDRAEKKSSVDLSTLKMISDSFFYSVSRIAILVIKPLKSIVLGNLLGPRLYGILNIPAPYMNMGVILSNIGFNTSVLKLMPGYQQEGRPDLARMIYRSSAFLTVALSTLWAVILLGSAPWVANHVAHEPEAVNPIRIYALLLPFLAVNTFFLSVFMAVQRGKLGAVIAFIYGLLNTLLPVAIVFWKRNVTVIAGGLLAAEVVGAVLYTACFHKKVLTGFGSVVGPLWRGIKETTRFGFLFFLGGLGWNLINSADRLMIEFYMTADYFAYYVMAVQIYTVLDTVAATLGLALVPSLTAAKERGEQAIFQRLVHNAARLGLLVLIPITVLVFVLAGDVFSLLLPRYGPSVIVAQIIVAISFLDLFCRIGWASLVAHNRGGLTAVAYIAAAVWNVTLCRLLIPPYGIIGAAVALLSTFVVLSTIFLIMMKRVSGARIYLMSLIHPLLLSLVYVVLGWLLRDLGHVSRLVTVFVGGSIVYAAGALLTGLIRKEDLDKAREMLTPRAAVRHVRFALGVIGVIERLNRFVGRQK